MKASSLFFCLGILCLGLASCNRAWVQYVRTDPSPHPPELFSSSLLVSIYDESLIPFTKDENIEAYHQSHRRFAEIFEERFFRELGIPANSQILYSTKDPAQDQALLKSVADTSTADLIIVAKQYRLYFEQEVVRSENENGSTSKTAYYDMVGEADFEAFKRGGERLFEERLIAKDLADERGVLSGLLAIGPTFRKRLENVETVNQDLISGLIAHFSPRSYAIQRSYFSKGIFKPLKPLMQQQQWQQAAAKLMELQGRHTDLKIQQQIAFNLAVVHEAMGNLEKMRIWREQAGDISEW